MDDDRDAAPAGLGPDDARSAGDEDDGATRDGQAERQQRSGGVVKPELSLKEGKVEQVAIEEINLEDDTYMFRAALRVSDLKKSLAEQGQQMPIILRARKRGQRKYQLISGFRRVTAAQELGWDSVAAIVRDLTDEEAFRASVLENTARKTYSDIDRAYVMRAYQARGFRNTDIGDLMGLKKRQVKYLKSLLDLPEFVQAAIDDEAQHFSATHALSLKRMEKKHRDLDYRAWIAEVNSRGLSVAQLIRAVNAETSPKERKALGSIFNPKASDWGSGMIRFAPVKVDVGGLSAEEKKALKAELKKLMDRL